MRTARAFKKRRICCCICCCECRQLHDARLQVFPAKACLAFTMRHRLPGPPCSKCVRRKDTTCSTRYEPFGPTWAEKKLNSPWSPPAQGLISMSSICFWIGSPPLHNALNGGDSSILAIRLLVQVHAVHRQRAADAHCFSGTSGTPFQCNVFRIWLPDSLI